MKYALWLLGIFLALVMTLVGLQYAASERVEVVQLYTADEAGKDVVTRLWVVDYNGHPWLRGQSDSGWFRRVQASDTLTLTRQDTTREYTRTIRNEHIGTINQLMREKYTWGDQLIGFALGTRATSNAIELTPLPLL